MIRTVSDSDVDQLLSYLIELREERLPTILRHAAVPTRDQEAAFIREFDGATAQCLVAEVEDRIVGALTANAHSHPQTSHSANLGMGVLSPYRGQGIGSALLEGAAA